MEFDPDEIFFTPGGQFGLAVTFHLLERAEPDGVVITPRPWYLNHLELAAIFGGERMFSKREERYKFASIKLHPENNFRITAELLQDAIDRTKKWGKKISAFLFCNPGNPLGNVISKQEWQDILPILEAHPEVPIMLDEAFAEIIYGDDFDISLLHVAPQLKSRTFLFRSGTKALGFSGERFALQTVPEKFRDRFTFLASRLIGNANLSSQAGMAAALENMSKDSKQKISNHYKKNRDYIIEKLEDLGIEIVHEPQGCFYLIAKFDMFKGEKIYAAAHKAIDTTKEKIENDFDVAYALLSGYGQEGKKGVATIPGSCFGFEPEDCYLRISYSVHTHELELIAQRLKNAVEYCKN